MTDTTNILGENMLLLADIAKPVFNITPRIAQRKAATNTLPVPAFRIGGTRKGPLYVLKDDLEKWVSERAASAKAQHRRNTQGAALLVARCVARYIDSISSLITA